MGDMLPGMRRTHAGAKARLKVLALRQGAVRVASSLCLSGCNPNGARVFPCDVEPSMTDRVVAWLANSGGVVMAMDLRTQKRYRLQPFDKHVFLGHIGPSMGTRVVWSAGRGTPDNSKEYIGVAATP